MAEPPASDLSAINTEMARLMDSVVVRFSGDSGDGMQLTGDQFTNTSAVLGNDISTFPDFPAEIRAPAGTLANPIPGRTCSTSHSDGPAGGPAWTCGSAGSGGIPGCPSSLAPTTQASNPGRSTRPEPPGGMPDLKTSNTGFGHFQGSHPSTTRNCLPIRA